MLTNSNNSNIDHDKILNSVCPCGTGLPWIKDNVVMACQCEHMYHENCFDKFMKSNNGLCKICGNNVIKKMRLFDDNIDYQQFVDILSMSYYENMCNNTPFRFLDSIFDVASVFARLPFTRNMNDGKELCEHIFSLNNLTLNVYGLNKTKLEKYKVYICNHVAHLELVVLYYLLGTGFLASSIVGNSSVLNQIKKVIPILTFSRGNKNKNVNIVNEMIKFVDEKGSICLFPEGLMKHPDVLVRFRSGAFHIGRPIYAITIRHNDIVSDGRINGFMYKLGAKKDINMEVHILGPYYPPFNSRSIESIRIDMSRVGKMALSRVSNRDHVDDK